MFLCQVSLLWPEWRWCRVDSYHNDPHVGAPFFGYIVSGMINRWLVISWSLYISLSLTVDLLVCSPWPHSSLIHGLYTTFTKCPQRSLRALKVSMGANICVLSCFRWHRSVSWSCFSSCDLSCRHVGTIEWLLVGHYWDKVCLWPTRWHCAFTSCNNAIPQHEIQHNLTKITITPAHWRFA